MLAAALPLMQAEPDTHQQIAAGEPEHRSFRHYRHFMINTKHYPSFMAHVLWGETRLYPRPKRQVRPTCPEIGLTFTDILPNANNERHEKLHHLHHPCACRFHRCGPERLYTRQLRQRRRHPGFRKWDQIRRPVPKWQIRRHRHLLLAKRWWPVPGRMEKQPPPRQGL